MPEDHWVHDPKVGGGRLIGEGCHFIDLALHLADSSITSHHVSILDRGLNSKNLFDNLTVNLKFSNGSYASIHYLSNGNKSFPKERVEVFAAGKVLQLDNFRTLKGWGWSNFKGIKIWRQNKGQKACAKAFMDAIQDGSPPPISPQEIFEVSRVAIEIDNSTKEQLL